MSSSIRLKDGSYLSMCSDVVRVTPAGPWTERKRVGGIRYYRDDQPISKEEAEALWPEGTATSRG